MTPIELTGRLICESAEEAEIVERHLPHHVQLTRAESGCLRFDVERTEDPLVWTVAERFVDQAAFDLHHRRVRSSEWGAATTEITRDYVITRSEH